MRTVTKLLLAASFAFVAVGCGDQTGSTINGGDPGPERLNPEPPYSTDTAPLGQPQETAETEDQSQSP